MCQGVNYSNILKKSQVFGKARHTGQILITVLFLWSYKYFKYATYLGDSSDDFQYSINNFYNLFIMYSIHSRIIKYSNNEYVNKMSDAKPFLNTKLR